MARKFHRKLAIQRRFSYTQTFEMVARHLLRTAKREISPLQFILGNKDIDYLLDDKKTEREVRKTGHAYFMVFELQVIYLQYHPDLWPVKLRNLQRSLGIASNVINENIVAFDRVRAHEKKKEKTQEKEICSRCADSWVTGQSVEGFPTSKE